MYAPVRREGIDDEQPPASFNGFPGRGGEALAARVRDLDPQPSAREEGEPEPEAPPAQPPVRDRVRRQFGDDERGRVDALAVTQPSPCHQLLHGEQASQAGTSAGGTVQLCELLCGS